MNLQKIEDCLEDIEVKPSFVEFLNAVLEQQKAEMVKIEILRIRVSA